MVESDENTRVGGGKACLEALRRLEILIPTDCVETAEDYFRHKEALISSLLSCAGELTPYTKGFMEALAEYTFANLEDGRFNIDLDVWQPQSSMGEAEKAAKRQIFANLWN